MKYVTIAILTLLLNGCGDYNQTAIINKNPVIKTNVNTATKEELMELSGIKEIKAQSIIDNRPYKSIYEIPTKTKVGDKVFNNIKKGLEI